MKIKNNLFSRLTISDYISILNFLVIVIGGVISYYAVDKIRLSFEATKDLREKTELIYLTTKIINDIRPKLEVTYTDYPNRDKFSKETGFIVTFKNKGPYHLIIEKAEFHASQSEIITKTGKNLSQNNSTSDAEISGGGQGIPPGGKLDLEVLQSFTEEVDLTKFRGVFDAKIVTDPVILDTLRAAFPSDYDFSIIEKLSTYHLSEIIRPIIKNKIPSSAN